MRSCGAPIVTDAETIEPNALTAKTRSMRDAVRGVAGLGNNTTSKTILAPRGGRAAPKQHRAILSLSGSNL